MKFFRILGILLVLILAFTSGNRVYARKGDKDLSQLYYYYLRAQMEAGGGNIEAAIENYKKAIACDPQSARLMLELSIALLHTDNLKEALNWAEKSAQIQDSVDTHFLLARIYTSLGQTDSAVKEYERVIKMNPENQTAYLLLGTLYIKEKRYEQAAAILEDLAKKDSTAFMAYYYLGRIYAEIKPSEAERNYLKAVQINPHFEPALVELAAYYEDSGDRTKLISTFEQILSFDPENPEILVGLGGSYLKEGRVADAIQQFEKAKTITKDNSSVLLRIGMIWLSSGKPDEAIKEFQYVTLNDPGEDKAHLYLGMTYADKGDLDGALSEFKIIPKGAPSYIEARIQVSNILRRQGKTGQAIDVLKEASASDAEKPEPYIALAQAYEDAEQLDEAEKILQTGVQKFPDSLDFQFQLGVIMDKKGDKQGSIAKMQAVIAADPRHAYALNYLGYVYADMGVNLDEAEQLVRRALKVRPNDGYITDSLGWVYYQKGLYDAAIQELEKAQNLVPGGDPVIAEHMGDVYYKKGIFSKALENYLKTETGYTKKKDKDRVSAKIEEVMSILAKDRQPSNAEEKK